MSKVKEIYVLFKHQRLYQRKIEKHFDTLQGFIIFYFIPFGLFVYVLLYISKYNLRNIVSIHALSLIKTYSIEENFQLISFYNSMNFEYKLETYVFYIYIYIYIYILK